MYIIEDVILTFDLDWCSDEVLEDTLNLLGKRKSIFFVTHKSKVVDKMRENSNYELGIHPNFNFLLSGDFRYGNSIDEVLKYYLDIIPEAKSIRSHCLTQSSIILDNAKELGLERAFNTLIPHTSNIELKPYKHSNGIIEYPHFWEDDVSIECKWEWSAKRYLDYKGLKVFNFHPIHIFLNSEDLSRYTRAKPYLQDFNRLKEFVNKESYGVRDFFIDLLKGIDKRGE